MEIAGLQAFIAVAETASFSLAAERLFITQPAVSKRIAALESELGSPLFDRIGRHVDLTEAGRALLPRARSILDQVEDGRRAIANLSGEISGELRIGTSHHIGLHRLPPILKSFSRTHPEVELNIRFMDSEAACAAVEHGDLELGIVTLPLTPSEKLTTETIWPDPLAVVCAIDHPLAVDHQATLEALAAHPAIFAAPGTFTRQIVEETFAPLDLHPKVAMSTNYLETIKMLVAIGLGWSVLPRTMVNELHQLEVAELKLSRRLGLIQHRARTPSNAGRAMVDLLHASVR